MPFSYYQRHAAKARTLIEKVYAWPLSWAEEQIVPPFSPGSPRVLIHVVLQAGGTALPSLAQDLLAAVQSGKKVSGEVLDYDDIKHICSVVYGGT